MKGSDPHMEGSGSQIPMVLRDQGLFGASGCIIIRVFHFSVPLLLGSTRRTVISWTKISTVVLKTSKILGNLSPKTPGTFGLGEYDLQVAAVDGCRVSVQ